MGTFKFNKAGIRKIRSMLEHQVMETQKRCATHAFTYLTSFGYHVENFKPFEDPQGGGYSLYYSVNWNMAVSGVDTSVISPKRKIKKAKPFEYAGYYKGEEYCQTVLEGVFYTTTISVTNSVYYGMWLNNGGFLQKTFAQNSNPNFFLEKCLAYIKNSAVTITQSVKKDCPNL